MKNTSVILFWRSMICSWAEYRLKAQDISIFLRSADASPDRSLILDKLSDSFSATLTLLDLRRPFLKHTEMLPICMVKGERKATGGKSLRRRKPAFMLPAHPPSDPRYPDHRRHGQDLPEID